MIPFRKLDHAIDVRELGAAVKLRRQIVRRIGDTWRDVRKAVRHATHPASSPQLVFIVACQRSGTNMTLRVFERSLDAVVYRRSDARVYSHSRLRDAEIIRAEVASRRSRLVILKPMNELQHTRRLLEAFPGLRVIWIVRSMNDVINSCVRRWSVMRETLGQVIADPASAR